MRQKDRGGFAWRGGAASAVALCLLMTGCVSTNVSVDHALNALRAGDNAHALTWAEDLKTSIYSKRLGDIEAGRVRMLSGDFLGSSTNFSHAIEGVIEKTENGPVVKVGDVGANVMAGTITDDRTRAYNIAAYEYIQALTYQMLDDLFLGKPDAAAVEARRAVFAQDAIAEKYGKAMQEGKKPTGMQATALGSVNAKMQGMEPVIQLSRSSYENGLTWYLCGLMFEQDQDLANASLACRKAWELTPGNPYVQRDFLRLLRTQDAEAYKGLMAQTGTDPQTLVRSQTEIIVIVEEGFVPQRQSVKVPIPVPGVNTLTSIDFPVYQAPAYVPMALEIREQDHTYGLSALAVSLQSLAYRDLKEKMPGIVVRNVTRVATRVAAQAVANQGGDAVKYGVMAFNVISTIINKADTRAWYTLPMVSHLYRGAIAPGEHMLELRNQSNGLVTTFPVKVVAGETRLIWVADIGGNARIATASLNGKGASATFQVCGSLLFGCPQMIAPAAGETTAGAPAANETAQLGYERKQQ